MESLAQRDDGWASVWRDRLTIGVFLLLVWLPLAVASARGFAPAVEAELRLPAPAPTFSARLPSQTEAWFDDRFGLRGTLVSLYGLATYELFGVSPTPRVIVGHDGWLFYTSSASTPPQDRLMTQHRGLRTLTPLELARVASVIEQDRAWLAERGIEYVLVVAPDKHSIYRDMLPERYTSLSTRTPLDQIAEELSRHPSLRFVDPRAALLAARQRDRVYAKTDTHWNALGAAVATGEVVNALREPFASIRPVELPRVGAWEDEKGLGLARMMGLENTLVEGSPLLEPAHALRARPDARDALLADASLAAHRKVLQAGILAVTDNDDARLPRAVVIQDSFGELMMPFFAESFSRVVFVHRVSGAQALEALIDVERPDVVVDEIAERMLVGLARRARGRFGNP